MSAYKLSERVGEHGPEVPVRPPSRDSLTDRLACPGCTDSVSLSSVSLTSQRREVLLCAACKTRFPLIPCGDTTIPWLFRCPDAARLEWSARYRGELQAIAAEHNRLNRALSESRTSPTGRKRISNALEARREHRRHVVDLLSPVELDGEDVVPAVTSLLQDKLPKNQGLASYTDNIFRDWAWENGENEALLGAVDVVLSADKRPSLGSVLTLGAGCCRLSYDVHRQFSPDLSVALDLNPLLLSIGGRVIQGEEIPYYEFPIAPLNENSCAILHQCAAPEPIRDDTSFRFVLGDASNPPFAPGSFDTVVTPWLIDIITQDLCDFIPQMNRLLPEGGLWLNTGTMAFFHQDPSRCYSETEVIELVEAGGFEIVALDRRRVPYLQSPHSGHGRTERIVSFTARKCREVVADRTQRLLPDWILDTSQAVPSATTTVIESSSHLLKAQVLAAIDGKRSIESISRMVSREYGLPLEECVHAVQRILADVYESDHSLRTSW